MPVAGPRVLAPGRRDRSLRELRRRSPAWHVSPLWLQQSRCRVERSGTGDRLVTNVAVAIQPRLGITPHDPHTVAVTQLGGHTHQFSGTRGPANRQIRHHLARGQNMGYLPRPIYLPPGAVGTAHGWAHVYLVSACRRRTLGLCIHESLATVRKREVVISISSNLLVRPGITAGCLLGVKAV